MNDSRFAVDKFSWTIVDLQLMIRDFRSTINACVFVTFFANMPCLSCQFFFFVSGTSIILTLQINNVILVFVLKANSTGNVVDLDGQLSALKSSYEKELREKDARHKLEVDQLKSDMLVAIQAASAVGNISSQVSPDARVTELETYIASLERDFAEERENLQNAIKKAESATKFGLRRNEEMSNKIYQMQREMEEIDSKYQKEIKLYKEAFDQEKNRKTTIGAVPGILAENESLKV